MTSLLGPASFPFVEPDEIGFALALFVSASNHRVPTLNLGEPQDSFLRQECMDAFCALSPASCVDTSSSPRDGGATSTLEDAFGVLWKHYHGDARRASVCARVLGFYYLMEGSRGAAVERWISPCPESPDVVLLHPAIVEAIANVPLSEQGYLPQSLFLATVEALACEHAGQQLQLD